VLRVAAVLAGSALPAVAAPAVASAGLHVADGRATRAASGFAVRSCSGIVRVYDAAQPGGFRPSWTAEDVVSRMQGVVAGTETTLPANPWKARIPSCTQTRAVVRAFLGRVRSQPNRECGLVLYGTEGRKCVVRTSGGPKRLRRWTCRVPYGLASGSVSCMNVYESTRYREIAFVGRSFH
jgi:hypothetical protein